MGAIVGSGNVVGLAVGDTVGDAAVHSVAPRSEIRPFGQSKHTVAPSSGA